MVTMTGPRCPDACDGCVGRDEDRSRLILRTPKPVPASLEIGTAVVPCPLCPHLFFSGRSVQQSVWHLKERVYEFD